MDTERYPAGRCPETAVTLPGEAEIAGRFRERLCLFAARRVNDAAAAEDVAQETLRRVIDAMRAGRVANPVAFPAFVFQTARHVCLQSYRASGREGRAMHRLHHEHDAHRQEAPDPLAALVSEERANRVRDALGGLSPSDRELLRLLYHQDMQTADVASRLGLTREAVRVRRHRALRRLGELLDEADF